MPVNDPSHFKNSDSDLISPDGRPREILNRHMRARRDEINREDIESWSAISSREDWEVFVRPRINALKTSLGSFPAPPDALNIHVTGTVEGEGYHIQNLVFESRTDIFVSANLYCPNPVRAKMPGTLLIHSHHNPKTQGELQDMGILWARAGCTVLVMDQFCYGDRRDHGFAPRQDYWFRSITGHQLHALGDSLMGWMVWDIHRGVDVLLSRPGIDPAAMIVMGAVAGGGDPCAVAAALDTRITCAVPFNFGGPQPETPYPMPEDVRHTFNYLGSRGWESTRNLNLSGRDGFLPWVILGAIAPRKLIYAHEFEWDQDRDPVWQRLQKIYAWYHATDNLDHAKGFGLLQGRPPQASHCNNIGVPHRQRIYGALDRWYHIGPPNEEVQERFEEDQLKSLTPQFRQQHTVLPVHSVLYQLGRDRSQNSRAQRKPLQEAWEKHLGNCGPVEADIKTHFTETNNGIQTERFVLTTMEGIKLPTLLLSAQNKMPEQLVIAMGRPGKRELLAARAQDYATLLDRGMAICLLDPRGTGETAPESHRGFRGSASSLSANALMFGQTMLGAQLSDLRTLIAHLRDRFAHIAPWGDSLAPVNAPDFPDPLIGEEPQPHHSEPMGGLLALYGALFEPEINAVVASGTFTGFLSLLENIFCYVPHDAIIPGALTSGDLCDIATAIAPTPLCLQNLVDGRNCPASSEDIYQTYPLTQKAYAKSPDNLRIDPNEKSDTVTWLIDRLASES
jgi:hypothetical protein